MATTEMVVNSYGNDTPEGALATWLSELQWAARAAATANGSETPLYDFLALPADPMFPNQWHLFNTGQEVGQEDLQNLFGVAGEDINVVPVWQGEGLERPYTGEGVLVAVVDSGVQLFHPDLISNIHPTLRLNASNGTTTVTPNLLDDDSFHGTAVAGLIGAAWNNLATDGSGYEGGTGVAPDVSLVPIKVDTFSGIELQNFLEFVLQNDIDITNNSWGPVHTTNRAVLPYALDPFGFPDPALNAEILQLLRDTVVSGRDGLGIIHVFASGNDAGPSFHTGWNPVGNYDSSSYNAWVNSRYTIGVTGVDHDGLYINADGTFTSYPTAGPSVLVAAPTGSSGILTIGDDDGFGSGLWTTDLIGDFGRNGEPLPSGFDPDRDLWPDTDYTSRMNGTSASAPLVSGVIALMLEAEPNLSYRDVQEILVRSARQNAQFEFPSSGAGGSLTGHLPPQNTWQVNQIGPFRNPDTWLFGTGQSPVQSVMDPYALPYDYAFPLFTFGFEEFAPDTLDGGRQISSFYEPQPALFTNGAGYTVSQGYGVYGEQIGYAHGVVDAELAVQMAERWFDLEHDTATHLSEKTFTTAIVSPGQGFFWNLPAAQKSSPPPDGIAMVVPGGIFGDDSWIGYWNEYFTDSPFFDDMGVFDYDGDPAEDRGSSYVDFAVPPEQEMDVEWVEVKLELSGDPNNLDFLRVMLTSPEGTQSELNNYYLDVPFGPQYSFQPTSPPPDRNDPLGTIQSEEGNFVWTFSTNRNWGESSNSVPILHPVTGEPLLDGNGLPIFRNWELHFENWSDGAFEVLGMEVIWHGKDIAGGTIDPNYGVFEIPQAQRVQGFVGLDTNADGDFNYNRYVQTLFGTHSDVTTIRSTDVFRQLDFNDNNFNGVFDSGDTINQEPFVENITVQAFRVFDGVAEAQPIAEFLTGHDGNYYFDFNVQADVAYANSIGAANFEYEIRVVDPLARTQLDDFATRNLPTSPNAPPGTRYLEHYKDVWRITPDWFFAPDRDNNPVLLDDEPGEILFDPVTGAPVPFSGDPLGFPLPPIPQAVKNINFLLKEDAPANEFIVNGTVYADLNGDGIFNGDDAVQPGAFVYWDINRDGESPGDPRVVTNANGQYTITVPVTQAGTFQFGVIQPPGNWTFTDPGGDGLESVFVQPGSLPQVINFFLQPEEDGGGGQLGNILGVVFNDFNEDGLRGPGEGGLSGITVFIDANENGTWESATELASVTASNGSYAFANLQPGLIRVDIHIPNEGTPNAAWAITTPMIGYREVQLTAGSTVLGQDFGVENRADRDWGDLPDSFNTTSTASPVGPSHLFVQGFRLGTNVDGEVNGLPSANADGDDNIGGADNGVRVVSNGGILQPGVNLVEVAVLGFGGVLTGWIDWNNSGSFDESERIIWRDEDGAELGGEADLVQGMFTLQVIAPAGMANGLLGARFRWGEPGLTFTGPAIIGEVEDYRFTASSAALSNLPGDYNNDSMVDVADYVIWRRFLGTSIYLPNDTTPGSVTQADYDVWHANIGMMAGAGAGAGEAAAASSESEPAPAASAVAPPTAAPEELIVASPAAQAAPVVASSSVVVVAPSAMQPAAIADSLTDVLPDSAPSTSPLAIDLALIGSSSNSFAAATNLVQSDAAVAAADVDANLLLLDEALADLDVADDDDPVVDRFRREEESVGDLELAAVFADESTNWWGV